MAGLAIAIFAVAAGHNPALVRWAPRSYLGAMIPTEPEVRLVASTIQLAVAPVFLLAGIGAFLNVCTGRLARVIDRARKLESAIFEESGAEHDRTQRELTRLDRRMRVVNWAIFLTVASAIVVACVVMLLFIAALTSSELGNTIALMFVAAMLLLIAAFVTFQIEVRLAARSIGVRQDALDHSADEGDVD